MSTEPQIEHLSYERRQKFFWQLVAIFLVSLPILIFYTTGYRLDFTNEENAIMSTGGVYVTTDNLEVDVYLDEEQVERPRLFRSAYYIQNIAIGQHRIVVQRPDLQTWVKELPVDPHIVIEASAFNVPVIPRLRPITEYVTATGTLVYPGMASTTDLFDGVTTTEPVLFALSKNVSAYQLNEEHIFVRSLFSSTSSSTSSVFDLNNGVERFRFASVDTQIELTATTTDEEIVSGDMLLTTRDGELYAIWQDTFDDIPFYFCVNDFASTSIADRYGEHVLEEINRLDSSTSTPMYVDQNRLCRPEIKIDRSRMDVYFYDFFPDSSDLVLLQLEDGLYVTEIDDRAWQNTQLLYSGKDFQVVVENDSIYIRKGGLYFEIITEIEPN